MDLTILHNDEVQEAVRRNRVSFPSQAPVYSKQSRADIQWRLAVLYFVRGWSLSDVAKRYGISRERAGQIITAWRTLSVQRGYIQEIPEVPVLNRAVPDTALPVEYPHIIPNRAGLTAATLNGGGLHPA